MQKSIGDVDPCRAALEDACIASWIVADLNSVAGAKKAIAELCQFEVKLATDPVFREPKTLGHKSRMDESDPVTEHALRAMNAAQNKEHCDTLIELQRINNAELDRLRARQPAAAAPDDVVRAELHGILEYVEGEMQSAYNNAYPECCGGGRGGECCGSPEPAWSKEDQSVIAKLAPVQSRLRALLAASKGGEA